VEYAQIQQTLSLEKALAKQSWRSLLKTPGDRKRVAIAAFLGLATQWSGNGLISYYLSPILTNVGITDALTKQTINLGITLWGAVTAFTIAFFSTRFPRRKVYLLCTSLILVVFIMWTAFSARFAETGDRVWSGLVVTLIFLYQPCYNMAFNALTYAYLPELFPYRIRTRGAAVFQWFSRAGLFLNTFVNPIGMQQAGWKYLTSYCVFIAFEIVFIYFMFPETVNKSIEELAFLFEKDAHAEQGRRIREQAEGIAKD
jgi:Na+/melibiose symporter-like transporter